MAFRLWTLCFHPRRTNCGAHAQAAQGLTPTQRLLAVVDALERGGGHVPGGRRAQPAQLQLSAASLEEDWRGTRLKEFIRKYVRD